MFTVDKKYGTYTYHDSDRHISIVFEQLDPQKYYISAHLEIVVWDDGNTPYRLYNARGGITTEKSRNEITGSVTNRLLGNERRGEEGMQYIFGLNHPIMANDWKATVNDACERVEKMYYEGEPPMNLYEQLSPESDIVWRVPGLLAENINVLYGHSGSGKSYLAIMLGQGIHHGVPVAGLRTLKGNVLLIDYETTPATMKKRFLRVDNGLDVTGSPMLYRQESVPLARKVETIQKWIVENDVDFIIVDSLARAVGGKITDEEGVIQFFEALKQLDIASLIIHHTNKSDEYYGSPFIRAYARSLYRLRSVHEQTGKLSIQLEQEKENDGPSMGSVGFVLEFVGDPTDPEAVTLQLQDPNSVRAFRQYLPMQEAIVGFLQENDHYMDIDRLKFMLHLNSKSRADRFQEILDELASPEMPNKYSRDIHSLFEKHGDNIRLRSEYSSTKHVNGVNATPELALEIPSEEGGFDPL